MYLISINRKKMIAVKKSDEKKAIKYYIKNHCTQQEVRNVNVISIIDVIDRIQKAKEVKTKAQLEGKKFKEAKK